LSNKEFTQRSEEMQDILEISSTIAGRESGFVERRSKLTAGVFVKTLVLGLLEKGDASLNELVGVGKRLGVEISASGLAQRMNEGGAELLKRLLVEHIQRRDEHSVGNIGVLSQFSAVNIVDSTQISLPESCQAAFAGSGGSASKAGAKIQVSYEYRSGTFNALEVGSGRVSDQASLLPERFACANSLTLVDLGYFKQATLVAIDQADAYFLTRLHTQVNLYWHATDTTKADVIGFLNQQLHTSGELTLYLGADARLPVRLVFRKRPPELVARERRRALRNAQKKNRICSPAHLAWLAWQVCITNLPPHRYTPDQIFLLYALRWQIELLFKLWKSYARLATVRVQRPERFLCLLYAHLLGLLLFHALIAPYRVQARAELSLPKAFQRFQRALPALIRAIAQAWLAVPRRLFNFIRALYPNAAKSSRPKLPSTRQRLALEGL
jgi:hypothetical protein